MDRMEKIRNAAKQHQEEVAAKESERDNRIKSLSAEIKSLAPRISELIKYANELKIGGLPIGINNEFNSEGMNHCFGFKNGYVNDSAKIEAIGIRGGGWSGKDFWVNESGIIIESTINESEFYNCWGRDKYKEFFSKCECFINDFEKFEKSFFEYIDSL